MHYFSDTIFFVKNISNNVCNIDVIHPKKALLCIIAKLLTYFLREIAFSLI